MSARLSSRIFATTMAIGAGALAALLLVPASASAFCVRNQTDITLSARQETPNPLGGFHTPIKPGEEACCDWFDRNCNPGGAREGLLEFRIRERRKQGPSVMYCDNTPKRHVFGVSNGLIAITKSAEKSGQLACDSRDLFNREVDPENYRTKKTLMPAPIMPPPIVIPELPAEAPDTLDAPAEQPAAKPQP